MTYSNTGMGNWASRDCNYWEAPTDGFIANPQAAGRGGSDVAGARGKQKGMTKAEIKAQAKVNKALAKEVAKAEAKAAKSQAKANGKAAKAQAKIDAALGRSSGSIGASADAASGNNWGPHGCS